MEIELYVQFLLIKQTSIYSVHTVYFLIKSIEGPEPIMRFHIKRILCVQVH
jgi:hypothetical protein